MKKNTVNTTQAQAQNTQTNNTNTKENTTMQKNAPKNPKNPKNEKKNPGADEKGFRASIDCDGVGHFAIPSIKADTVDGAKVYTYSAHAKASALCRNSIKSDVLAKAVQLAIVRRELDRVAITAAKLTKKLADEKGTLLPIERDRIQSELDSLTAAKEDMKSRFPGCVKFSFDANPHATLCAAGVLEAALALDLTSFNTAMLAAAAVCRSALDTKSNGEGAKAFTPEEREKLSAVKDEAVSLFTKYCTASDVNKAFALRVKDADVFTWYEMHKVIRGERKKYAEELADMSKTLTMWFLGKIYKEAAQETAAQPKQEKQNK